jgi:lipopolysaccharide biosynthesis regulator YciM
MAQLYFHCTGSGRAFVDRSGMVVDDLVEARDRAVAVARQLISMRTLHEDWRKWIVHVSDEEGEEVFLLPFADIIGRLH